ncbi:hypothetical protein JTB14_026096 [Gonioctena quinquepunctata]|nr:hypothetical protein JTB14_026096 [Gonioctena quinquepunctata]
MSLKELFEEMEKRYGINFILTSKLNQDAVENLFGQLRSRGGLDDHPTSMNLLYRLRMVVLGKTPGMVHEKTKVLRYEDKEEYLLATVFKVAEVEPSD